MIFFELGTIENSDGDGLIVDDGVHHSYAGQASEGCQRSQRQRVSLTQAGEALNPAAVDLDQVGMLDFLRLTEINACPAYEGDALVPGLPPLPGKGGTVSICFS